MIESFAAVALNCVRGERIVFQDLSFDLKAGDCLTLIGHNGAGKSSLLRLIAGLLKPFSGQFLVNGQARADFEEDHDALLHYIGHHDAVKPTLSVAENLLFWRDVHGGQGGGHSVGEALDRFGIAHLETIHGRFLSAGQKRRTALARLLVAHAPLWLLDEPTTALDQDTIGVLEHEIDAHRAQGGIVVLSTHSPLKVRDQQTLNVGDYHARRGDL